MLGIFSSLSRSRHYKFNTAYRLQYTSDQLLHPIGCYIVGVKKQNANIFKQHEDICTITRIGVTESKNTAVVSNSYLQYARRYS